MTAVMTGPTLSRNSAPEVSEERFLNYLRGTATALIPEFRSTPLTIQPAGRQSRRGSSLFEFRLSSPDHSASLLIKVPFRTEQGVCQSPEMENRPRLFPPGDPATSGLREFLAMRSVHEHFSQAGDVRFGSVRMLDLLQSPPAIVMDKCPDPNLKARLTRATRLHAGGGAADLSMIFRNSGAWLRQFHDIPPLPHTQSRHTTRNDYVEATRQMTLALGAQLGRRADFTSLHDTLASAAARILPDTVPCGTVHGDFAPRNILTASNGRITVIDTQRRWFAPVYEDLAYLLMSIKLPAVQMLLFGLPFSNKQLADWESSLLRGYFDQRTIPLKAVRLYEILQTLEFRAAIEYRNRSARPAHRLRTRLKSCYLERHIQRLLRDLT